MKKTEREKQMNRIESYIRRLKHKTLNSQNISVVLFDNIQQLHYYLFRVNIKDNYCMMIVDSSEMCSVSEMFIPFISDMDLYYPDVEIIEDSPFIGMNYLKVQRIIERK